MPTAGTETYLEVLEGLLGRKGLSVAHRGDNDTDRRGLRESFQTTSKTETQLRNRSWGLYFNNYGAYHIPDRAVTTTEQRRSLTQYPPHPPGADTRSKRNYNPTAHGKETTNSTLDKMRQQRKYVANTGVK